MVSAENQEQNEYYTFKVMLLQPDKSDFILYMIKEYEAHEAIRNLTLIEKSEVNNNHKIKTRKLRLFYHFSLSSAKDSQIED